MLISFLNDVDIKLILEFQNSVGKYHQVFPINPKRALIVGHPVHNDIFLPLVNFDLIKFFTIIIVTCLLMLVYVIIITLLSQPSLKRTTK